MIISLNKPLYKHTSKNTIKDDIAGNLTSNGYGEVKINTIQELNELIQIINKHNIKIIKVEV